MVLRNWLRICAVMMALIVVTMGSARADYLPDEVLVKYKAGRKTQTMATASAVHGQVVRSLDQIRYQRIKLPRGTSVAQAISDLKTDPNVEYAGPSHVFHVCRAPNDDMFVNGMHIVFEIFGEIIYEETFYQWWLDDTNYPIAGIDAQKAWDITTGEGSNIIIAIADSGVRSDHEDLSAKIIPGFNAIAGANPNDTEDDLGHGTEVAGVAAAMTNNSVGVAGICWGAKIMPIKVIDSSGAGVDADAAAGIIWAADHGAKIINMSFGDLLSNLPEGDTVLKDAVDYAWNKGCVLVGGSGNDGVNDAFYPACFDNVLAVGATAENGQRATAAEWGGGGSNYGPWLDVVAPGTNMLSTTNADPGYEVGMYDAMLNGTSFSTPVATGVAALLWSKYPDMTNAQIISQIKSTCKDIGTPGWDIETGYGIVSAYRALSMAPDNAKSIGQLAGIASGNVVKVVNAIITSGTSDLADRLYVEQADRACGIMLPFATKPAGYVEGDRVDIMGTLNTINGERAIQGAMLSKTNPGTALKPIGMGTKWVGGTRLGSKSGITNGIGTNNVGLLVTVYGRVTAVGWTYFYIDDGAGMRDGSGMRGLKVLMRNFTKPALGDYVKVTGISSIEQPTDAGVSIPVIRVRKQSDVGKG